MGKLSLVIADANKSTRARLKVVLCGISGVEIVGEAADLGSAVAIVENLLPDAVIIGDELPQGKEFVIRSMRSLFPSIRVIELSVLVEAAFGKAGEPHPDAHFNRDALNELIAGSSRGSLW